MTLQLSAGCWVVAACCLVLSLPAMARSAPIRLDQDKETIIGGIGVACTGIAGSKADPRWQAYAFRIEFANERREHLIGAEVKLRDRSGALVLSVACWGSWLLLQAPGDARYTIEATIIGEAVAARTATLTASAEGQTRIVLEFPGVDA